MPRRTASPARRQRPLLDHIREQSTTPADRTTRIEFHHPRTLYTLGLGATLSCGTEDIDAGSEVPWHKHDDAEEMLFCTRGVGRIYVGNEESEFVPGVMALVPRQTMHRIVNESTSSPLGLAWVLSPPKSPAQFRAGGGTGQGIRAADCEPWLHRRLRWLFPKLSGEEYARAMPFVSEMYFDGPPVAPFPRARVIGRILHVTCHAWPHEGWAHAARLGVLLALTVVWAVLTSTPVKAKALLVALLYSATEFGFTLFLERGRGYTSGAQFAANVLYAPILLDAYAASVSAVTPSASAAAMLYVGLFPLNIWLYEAILGHALVWLYGRNVAWCYADYADTFANECCRLGHGLFWVGLGGVCLLSESAIPMVEVTS